jgi:hypothetical protein
VNFIKICYDELDEARDKVKALVTALQLASIELSGERATTSWEEPTMVTLFILFALSLLSSIARSFWLWRYPGRAFPLDR